MPRMSFGELQEKAKVMFSNSTTTGEFVDSENVNTGQLLQFIEEFCREGDRVVDESKRDKVDLQNQVGRLKLIGILHVC